MNLELIKARVVSFAYEAGALLLVTFIGFLSSEEFSALIGEHFGTGAAASLLVLAISAGTKHLRNLKLVKKYEEEQLGSDERVDPPILI